MPNLNYLLLSVAAPLESARLYTSVLGREPVETAETFVLYALPSGLKIGLWHTDDVLPTPKPAGGIEISFTLDSRADVDTTFADWTALGLKPVQSPTEMDFGYTCVVEDPDGHRLRPFTLSDDPR